VPLTTRQNLKERPASQSFRRKNDPSVLEIQNPPLPTQLYNSPAFTPVLQAQTGRQRRPYGPETTVHVNLELEFFEVVADHLRRSCTPNMEHQPRAGDAMYGSHGPCMQEDFSVGSALLIIKGWTYIARRPDMEGYERQKIKLPRMHLGRGYVLER
jgi:hypothetical protein